MEQGAYDIRLICTLEDNSEIIFTKDDILEFGNIQITEIYEYNSDITAELYELSSEKFNGNDLVKGDTSYKIELEPKGKYFPDKEAKLPLEGKGTQRIKAKPDLDYMAAIRVNYEELLAEVAYSGNVSWSVKSRAEVGGQYDDDTERETYTSAQAIESDIKMVSYDITSDSLNRFSKQITFVIDRSDSYNQPNDIVFWVPFPPLFIPPVIPKTVSYEIKSKSISCSPNVIIKKGKFYTTYDSSCSVERFTASESGRRVTVSYRVRYTINIYTKPETGPNPPGTFDEKNYFSYCDGIAAMSPDLKQEAPPVPYIHQTPFVYKDMPTIPVADLLDVNDIYESTNLPNDYDPNDPGNPKNQDIENIWRAKRRILFYAIGELTASSKNNFSIPIGGKDLEETPEFLTGTINKYVTDMNNGETREYINGEVKFILSKNNNKYSVSVSTDATEDILYPYPPEVTDIALTHIIENNDVGIPVTRINGQRSNDQSALINYHINPSDVIFGNTKGMIETDFIYEENKYSGEFNWFNVYDLSKDIMSSIDPKHHDKINIKIFSIDKPNFIVYNNGTENSPEGILNYDDIVLPDTYPLNDNLKIEFSPQIDDVRFDWDLSDDPFIGFNKLIKGNINPDLSYLNKYGLINKQYISDLYPDEGSTFETSMYKIDQSTDIKSDNHYVVVTPSTGGEYKIVLEAIDNNEFKGLDLDNIKYSENKLNDTFDILLAKDSPNVLVPIYGKAVDLSGDEKKYELQYFNSPTNNWIDIPVYNPDKEKNILTYWDITGVATGLYTLRLVSKIKINGNVEININERNINLGQLYTASIGQNEDMIYESAYGNAKIIFPKQIFNENILVNITPVDVDSITDIALLPDIAPVGKVIKLYPEDITFNEPVELQFIYNKLQLTDIDPEVLKIYNISKDGELVPLNTMIKYVLVEFDANGNVIKEVDGSKQNYTYVKIWAYLDHFSYYTVFEGNLAAKPKLDQDDLKTNKKIITFTGSASPNDTIALYCDDDPYFKEETEKLASIAKIECDSNGKFVFNNINIPNEGKNYYFFASDNINGSGVAKLVIDRDTMAPEIIVDDNNYYMSPNNDSFVDSSNIQIKTNEKSNLRMIIFNEYERQMFDEERVIAADCLTTFTIKALDKNNFVWEDGEYKIVIYAYDELQNESIADNILLHIDTAPVNAYLDSISSVISPEVIDGVNDVLDIKLNIDDNAVCSLWIVNAAYESVKNIVDSENTDKGIVSYSWDGRDVNGNYVADGEYYIKYMTIDALGNIGDFIFEEDFYIDNAVPEIELLSDSTDVIIPGKDSNAIFHLFTNEPIDIEIKIFYNGSEISFSSNTIGDKGYFYEYWNLPSLLEHGIYSVYILASDMAGNKITLPEWQILITEDNTPPVSSYGINGVFCNIDNFLYISKESSIVLDAVDDNTGINKIYYKIDNEQKEYTTPLKFFIDGQYVLEYWAIDKAGNTENTNTIEFIVDNTPPHITLTEIEDKIYRHAVTPGVDISDPILKNYELTLNDNEYAENTPISFPGDYVLKIYAEDKLGNISEKQVNFTIDPTFMSKVTGVDFYFIGEALKVVWNKVDEIDLHGYYCYVNGKKIKRGALLKDLLIKEESIILGGSHEEKSIEITSVDQEDHESEKSGAVEIVKSNDVRMIKPKMIDLENGFFEIRMTGITQNCEDIIVEYSSLHDNKPIEWQRTYNGTIDNDGNFDFVAIVSEEDLINDYAFRVSGVSNDKRYYSGDISKGKKQK